MPHHDATHPSPALLLIDVQAGFDDPAWGRRNNADAEAHLEELLTRWRERRLPVIHVRHRSVEENSPLRPDRPGFAFKPFAEPIEGEAQFEKTVNSAFIGTELERHLRERGIESLVIAGLTTDHCVSTSTRMAGNLGFDVRLVSNATATFDRVDRCGDLHRAEDIHRVHLASLDGEFCEVVTAREVLEGLT